MAGFPATAGPLTSHGFLETALGSQKRSLTPACERADVAAVQELAEAVVGRELIVKASPSAQKRREDGGSSSQPSH
jgi:hypothetical protein